MRILRTTLLGLLSVGLLAIASPASAGPITVLNSSFELADITGFTGTTPDDWTVNGTGTGLNDIDTGVYAGAGAALVGEQVAFANANRELSQVLTETLTAAVGTTYELTVAVGLRSDLLTGDYDIQLLAGSTVLANVTGSAAALFADVDFTYVSTGLEAEIGQALQIVLASTATQTQYDNVRLTSTAIPEPSSLLLVGLGMLGLIGYRRRRR